MTREGWIALFFAVLFLGTGMLHAAHACEPSPHDRGAHSRCGHSSVCCDPAFSTSALPRATDAVEGRASSRVTAATIVFSPPALPAPDVLTEPPPRGSAPF